MKKRNIKKNIILILLLNLFSINVYSVYAETFNQNGLTFTKGEHKPDKRVYKKKVIPKNPKVLEVIIRPEHGRDLKPEEMENYVPTNKILVGEDNLEEVFTEVNREKYPLELKSGAHVTVGGVWTNASSRELKENISDIDGLIGLSTVLKLKPVTYNYKIQPGETYAGFIAEDVPDIVSTSDRKSLSPMDVVAVVVGAIQEIWHKITSILDRLDKIENKLGIQSANNLDNNNSDNEGEDDNQNSGDETEDENIDGTGVDESVEETDMENSNNQSENEEQGENDTENQDTDNIQDQGEDNSGQEDQAQQDDENTNTEENQSLDNSGEEIQENSDDISENNNEGSNDEIPETDIENTEDEVLDTTNEVVEANETENTNNTSE